MPIKPLPVRYIDSGYGYVYMTLDGYTAVRILENDFWLDKNKLSKSPLLARSFSEAECADDKELTLKNYMADDKGTPSVCVLSGKTFDTKIRVSNFTALCKKGCKMYANGKKLPVYFTLDGAVYAICMPIKT